MLTTDSEDGRHVDADLAIRIQHKVGSTTRFRRIPTFDDWLRGGPKASAAARTMVEPQIAGYLSAAEAIGQREGVRRGLTIGVGLALAIAIITLIAVVLVRIF